MAMDIERLYTLTVGCAPESVKPLTPAGSNRRYYRLTGPETLVGVEGTSRAENEAFIYLSRHFGKFGLPVPEIRGVSDDRMTYLQTDLGDTQLINRLDDTELLEKTVRALARLHYVGSRDLDYSICFPVAEFDNRSVLWDLNYFKYSFLNPKGKAYDEVALQRDFERLAGDVGAITERKGTFMYRDFQSRNVMVKDGEPYFIDFQGGRRGPAAYDLASFLYQAKAGFSLELRNRLTEVYLLEASGYEDISREEFNAELRLMTLVRSLQTLGAYGLRGLFERKPHFLQSIPGALNNLKSLVGTGGYDRYPYLMEVIGRLCETEEVVDPAFDGLTVRVNSFSFKKGIPDDPGGNGGGFVFDCRAMDNPGRYQEYRSLTGRDTPVIDFLEKKGEITDFLSACYSLADAAIDNYLSRGFSSLIISFGCTGGQHRSVYSADHMARHIKERTPEVRVILTHREQSIREIL